MFAYHLFSEHDKYAKEKMGQDILGCFYIKPNFPGRCAHICNGGFIVNPNYRGKFIQQPVAAYILCNYQ